MRKMTKVSEPSSTLLDDLKKISILSGYLPYRYIKEKRQNIELYWLEEVDDKINKGSYSLLLMSGEKIKGFVMFEDLPWDSKYFGNKMGAITNFILEEDCESDDAEILLDELEKYARKQNYSFILAKSYTDNVSVIQSLEKKGFYLVDTLLDFVWDRCLYPVDESMLTGIDNNITVVNAKMEDEDKLRQVANSAFSAHFGRYHSDRCIPNRCATKVYEEWISSSLRGYADLFLVARVDGQIAGYSIWKNENEREKKYGLEIGHYSIAGIDPAFKGKGLFKILTMEGMKVLSKTVRRIEGPTHINNYPVQNGYTKLNWRISDARHSFHKWLKA
jgi:dTDP-4-amino-4,6-dideoxy-D-galactose acyltransferase